MTAVMLKQEQIHDIVTQLGGDTVSIMMPNDADSPHLIMHVPDGVIIGEIDDEMHQIPSGIWRIAPGDRALVYSEVPESDYSGDLYTKVEPNTFPMVLDDLKNIANGASAEAELASPQPPAEPATFDHASSLVAPQTEAQPEGSPQPSSDIEMDDSSSSPAMAARGRQLADQQAGAVKHDAKDVAEKRREPQGAGGISLGLGQLASGAAEKVKAAASALNNARPRQSPDPLKAADAKIREASKHARDYRAAVTQLADHYQHFQDAGEGAQGRPIKPDTVNSAENHENISRMRRETSTACTKAQTALLALQPLLANADAVSDLIERHPSLREDIEAIGDSMGKADAVLSTRFLSDDKEPMSPLVAPMAKQTKLMKEALDDLITRINEIISSMLNRFKP
ncbi:hypothetical protein [Alcanivorax sp. 1008]|uniref:hypothetical protein n=1 Tax=Alcanivorax sp. 1008 TaxID=2816853 RepID=UPI001DBDAFE2|nr:hypothetical protein [Alcanivorax sp. 1008]MCC1496738.1 hypothetical protein [Alcanivorax sp. 1008]